MTRLELDALAAGGCQCPECQEGGRGCGGPMIVSGRCHPRHGCTLSYDDLEGVTTLSCAKCGRRVLSLYTPPPPFRTPPLETAPCCPREDQVHTLVDLVTPVKARYTEGSGILTLDCWKCGRRVGELPITK